MNMPPVAQNSTAAAYVSMPEQAPAGVLVAEVPSALQQLTGAVSVRSLNLSRFNPAPEQGSAVSTPSVPTGYGAVAPVVGRSVGVAVGTAVGAAVGVAPAPGSNNDLHKSLPSSATSTTVRTCPSTARETAVVEPTPPMVDTGAGVTALPMSSCEKA
jgi:hypothetical protein